MKLYWYRLLSEAFLGILLRRKHLLHTEGKFVIKKTASKTVTEEYLGYPTIHRLAFHFAHKGYRGSSHIWRIARKFKRTKNGQYLMLPTGFVMKVNEHDWISKTIYEGTYERALLKFLQTLDLEDTVIDIGANIGVTLWHSLVHNQSNTTFLAYEPSIRCEEGLKLACSRLSAKGELNFFAIGSVNGKLPLYGVGNQSHSGSASFLLHSGINSEKVEVEVRTLDSVMSTHGKSKISLLKVDTEGFESEVIKGGEHTLKSQRIDIIIMEVSPNFGPTRFLTNLERMIGNEYFWLRLDETGLIKRIPVLEMISCIDALRFTSQWNLVLMRREVFTRYKEKTNSITIAITK